MVVLITGKQNAGKTTYSNNLFTELSIKHKPVVQLDGDVWRKMHSNDDYSDEGRERNLISAAKQAAEWEEKGYIVLVAFVSPLKKWRDKMREYWKESMVIYLPGGLLWKDTVYEAPDFEEMKYKQNKNILSWQE